MSSDRTLNDAVIRYGDLYRTAIAVNEARYDYYIDDSDTRVFILNSLNAEREEIQALIKLKMGAAAHADVQPT